MRITDLQEGYLLSLHLEQSKLFIELSVLASDNKKYKVVAFNADTSKIDVSIGELDLRSGLSTLNGIPTMGELESVGLLPSGFIMEGDFGDITVRADRITIEPVL